MPFVEGVSKLFVAGRDLSPFVRAVDFPVARTLGEVTSIVDTGRTFIPSVQEAGPISIDAMFNDAADSPTVTFDALFAQAGAPTQVLLYLPMGEAAGSFGQAGVVQLGEYGVSTRIGEIVLASARATPDGVVDRVKVVEATTTRSATANSASVDDAASSATGGTFWVHVTAASATGGNARWQLILQDSPDDAAWADVATINISDTADPTGLRAAFTGTLDRYTRLRSLLDATSGSMTAMAAYHRDGKF